MIIAYQCVSKNYDWLRNYECFFFNKDIYQNGKNGYIQLHKVYNIPIENIKFKYKELYNTTLMKLNKRLLISHYHDNYLPLFDVEVFAETGDMIEYNNELYYVYKRYDNSIYVNPVYKDIDKKDQNEYYYFENQDQSYYVSLVRKEELNTSDDYRFVDIVNDIKAQSIERAKSRYRKEKSVPKKPIDIDSYSFKYPMGQTFYIGMKDYVYLYHLENVMYVLEGMSGEYDLSPRPLKQDEYLGKGHCFDKMTMLSLYQQIIKKGYDTNHIISKILLDCFISKQ